MAPTVNVPISVAARKGVSAVVALAQENRVALTSRGRVVAVVDSPDRVDDEVRAVREAAWAVLEMSADLAVQRSRRYSLEQVCARVGVDVARVRERAAELRSWSDTP